MLPKEEEKILVAFDKRGRFSTSLESFKHMICSFNLLADEDASHFATSENAALFYLEYFPADFLSPEDFLKLVAVSSRQEER
ncbi:Amidophosphoribosyltransferase (plasmid) [Neochlamydia sp. S13]|nr:Amidophosphoribosyltransferase [Neochlamydia sp. S13]